jgi:hypothetical protein
MRKYIYYCILGILLCSSQAFAQKVDTCATRLALARDLYETGKLSDALKLVDEYQKCSGLRSSEF